MALCGANNFRLVEILDFGFRRTARAPTHVCIRMTNVTDNNRRFDGLAEVYAAHRPSYPQEIMSALADRLAARGVPRFALDVGCGTGISTLALASVLPGWRIVGVEPNDDMRGEAEAACARHADVELAAAPAEALPGANGSVGLVAAAQAIHWFDRPRFFAEAARVLAPDGVLAILYNNRDNAAALLSTIEDKLEAIEPGYSRDYRDRDIPAMLRPLGDFRDVERVAHRWYRPMTLEALASYFLSRSMMKSIVARIGEDGLREVVITAATPFAEDGIVQLPFNAELDMAVRH